MGNKTKRRKRVSRRIRKAQTDAKVVSLEAAREAKTALDKQIANDLAAESGVIVAEVIDTEAPAEDGVPWDDDEGSSPSVDRSETRRITVMTDHKLVFPDIWLSVFIAGDLSEEIAFAQMLVRAACRRAATPDEADVVIFTGGEDVNPALYGEAPHPKTYYRDLRDQQDIALYLDCLEKGIPMIGVCRGAQLLHVMNGGKLFQDVDGHQGGHSMTDTKTKEVIDNISSVHHQMCRPNRAGGMEILGVSAKSRKRWLNNKESDAGMSQDIEAFFYRDTCCLGVQGHPEYRGYNAYTKWFLQQMENYINLNPDLVLDDVTINGEDGTETLSLRRVPLAVREQRKDLLMKAMERACVAPEAPVQADFLNVGVQTN